MSDSNFASLGPSLLARKGGAKPAMRPQVAPLVTEETVVPEEALEDLGWNDMGDPEHDGGAEIVPINADVSPDGIPAHPGPIVRRQQRRLEERVLADAAMTGPEDCESDYEEDEESLYGEDYDAEDYDAEDYDAAGYAEGEDYDDGEGEYDGAIYSPLAAHLPAAEPAAAPARAPLAVPREPAKPRVPATQSGRRAAFTLRLDADRHLKLRLAATMQGVSAQALVTEALDRLLAEHDELEIIANHLKRN
jgi:hypothetical protein